MTETILEEAIRLTSVDRNDDYGCPLEDYSCTAMMFHAMIKHKLKDGETITYQDAIRFMCCVKLSRDSRNPKRDHMVDLAGYAHCRQWALESDETD